MEFLEWFRTINSLKTKLCPKTGQHCRLPLQSLQLHIQELSIETVSSSVSHMISDWKLKNFQRREQRVSGILKVIVRNWKKKKILGSVNGSTIQKSFTCSQKSRCPKCPHIINIFNLASFHEIPKPTEIWNYGNSLWDSYYLLIAS